MARRSRRPIVPQAAQELDQFKARVMHQEGYQVNQSNPNQVKYEVARTLGVPLTPGYNGGLTTEDAGRVGGKIGGSMVREMIRLAQQQMAERQIAQQAGGSAPLDGRQNAHIPMGRQHVQALQHEHIPMGRQQVQPQPGASQHGLAQAGQQYVVQREIGQQRGPVGRP